MTARRGEDPAGEGGDELPRRYEGQAALQRQLAAAGTVADVEDVVGAFQKAIAQGVPANVVIAALWDEEPRFDSPDAARRLFGNLLSLYELVERNEPLDLAPGAPPRELPRAKAPKPDAWTGDAPDEAYLEACWAHLHDWPRERARLNDKLENLHDALLQWLDAEGLSDAAYGLARQLAFDTFAALELAGRAPQTVALPPPADPALPASLEAWLTEALTEATNDDAEPLAEPDAAAAAAAARRAMAALWAARAR